MASLKVIFITLFKATFTALFTGFELVTTGGVLSSTFKVVGVAACSVGGVFEELC